MEAEKVRRVDTAVALPLAALALGAIRSIRLTPEQLGVLAKPGHAECLGTGRAGYINGQIVPCVCVRKRITRMVAHEVVRYASEKAKGRADEKDTPRDGAEQGALAR